MIEKINQNGMKNLFYTLSIVLLSCSTSIAQDRSNPVVVVNFVSVDDVDIPQFTQYLDFVAEMQALRVEEGYIDFFHVWEVMHDSYPSGDIRFVVAARTSLEHTMMPPMEDWQGYASELATRGIESPFPMGSYDISKIYQGYFELAEADEITFSEVVNTVADGQDIVEPGWIASMNFMLATSPEYQALEAQLLEMNEADIAAGGKDGWGFISNVNGYPTDTPVTHMTLDFWNGMESFLSPSTYEMTSQDLELVNDVVEARDLRRLLRTRLIIAK